MNVTTVYTIKQLAWIEQHMINLDDQGLSYVVHTTPEGWELTELSPVAV